jgi:site-specific DNA recombinase
LLDRNVEASNDSVVAAYEKRIAKLEREKVLALEKLSSAGKPKHTFEESLEHAMRFLANPWHVWDNSDLAMKKTVLRLASAEPLPYCRNQGLRTPNLAFPFKALGEICSGKSEMAHPTGFEPVTSAFGGHGSQARRRDWRQQPPEEHDIALLRILPYIHTADLRGTGTACCLLCPSE